MSTSPNILIPGNLLDITHALQIPTDSPLADTILQGKLFQCLFAFNIICNDLRSVPTDATVKTSAAIIAFIPLRTAPQAISDHIPRPAEKAFF